MQPKKKSTEADFINGLKADLKAELKILGIWTAITILLCFIARKILEPSFFSYLATLAILFISYTIYGLYEWVHLGKKFFDAYREESKKEQEAKN